MRDTGPELHLGQTSGVVGNVCVQIKIEAARVVQVKGVASLT